MTVRKPVDLPYSGDPTQSLTNNEMAVLHGAATGETYAAIGRRIGVTEKSVGNIAVRVVRKLDADNITHAVHLAHGYGLLNSGAAVDMPQVLVQVLELVAEGRTNADIARRLCRSEYTVADQVKEARRRLGARDRAHAAALAVALRIVRVDLIPAAPTAVVDAA